MAFSEPGDAILLQVPSYPPFMRAIEDTRRGAPFERPAGGQHCCST